MVITGNLYNNNGLYYLLFIYVLTAYTPQMQFVYNCGSRAAEQHKYWSEIQTGTYHHAPLGKTGLLFQVIRILQTMFYIG